MLHGKYDTPNHVQIFVPCSHQIPLYDAQVCWVVVFTSLVIWNLDAINALKN